ncbi:hypothetical protein pb186bvf_015353 [Paramecium bursaria]
MFYFKVQKVSFNTEKKIRILIIIKQQKNIKIEKKIYKIRE